MTCRAVATLLACLLAVGCSDSDESDTAPSTTTSTAVLERGTQLAIADAMAHGQVAIHVADVRLPMSEGVLLLAFDPLGFADECLVSLDLVIPVVEGGGELGVYPSIETGLATFTDGTRVGGTLLRSNRPRAVDVPEAGQTEYRWDVLEHYTTDAYVNDPAYVPLGEPFALAVRPLGLLDHADAVFSSSESGNGPRLEWAKRAGCP